MDVSTKLAKRTLNSRAEEEFLARSFIINKSRWKNHKAVMSRFEAQVYGSDPELGDPTLDVIQIMKTEPKPSESTMPTWTYPTLVRYLADLNVENATLKQKTELKKLAEMVVGKEKKDLEQKTKEKSKETSAENEEETDEEEEEELPIVLMAYEYASDVLKYAEQNYAWDCVLS